MIADTTLIIDVLRGNPQAREAIEKQESLQVTTPTISEIFAGIHHAKRKEQQRIQQVLETYPALALDSESAVQAGHIRSQLKQQGQDIDLVDCMIAGIAMRHGKAVITRNEKHFGRISRLRVETY